MRKQDRNRHMANLHPEKGEQRGGSSQTTLNGSEGVASELGTPQTDPRHPAGSPIREVPSPIFPKIGEVQRKPDSSENPILLCV